MLKTQKRSGSRCLPRSPILRSLQITQLRGVPLLAPWPAFHGYTQILPFSPQVPALRRPLGRLSRHCKPKVVLSCPALPALGPRSSVQHKAAAVQERTLNSFSEQQAQTDEVVFTRTQVSIYSVLCRLSLSQAPASQLPGSSSRRENTGAEAKDSRASVRLLVLTHSLALLSHLTSLPSIPSLKKDKEAGFDWAGPLYPGEKQGGCSGEQRQLSPQGSQPSTETEQSTRGRVRLSPVVYHY